MDIIRVLLERKGNRGKGRDYYREDEWKKKGWYSTWHRSYQLHKSICRVQSGSITGRLRNVAQSDEHAHRARDDWIMIPMRAEFHMTSLDARPNIPDSLLLMQMRRLTVLFIRPLFIFFRPIYLLEWRWKNFSLRNRRDRKGSEWQSELTPNHLYGRVRLQN